MGSRANRNGISFLLMLGIGRWKLRWEGMFLSVWGFNDVMRWLLYVGCFGDVQASKFDLMVFTINAIRSHFRRLYDNSSYT